MLLLLPLAKVIYLYSVSVHLLYGEQLLSQSSNMLFHPYCVSFNSSSPVTQQLL